MLLNLNTITFRFAVIIGSALLLFALALTSEFSRTQAQSGYNSGSTGADGAFNPTVSQTIQVPESGVFNYTTVNIPINVVITYKRNSRNTPVTILTTGNVVINTFATISVDGAAPVNTFRGGLGGPGGFDGGGGGALNGDGFNGSGPGGGKSGKFAGNGPGGGGSYATAGTAGTGAGAGAAGAIYGASTLVPLIGGSGGGGNAGSSSVRGPSGSGGGGAILIASSGTISGTGSINARGAGAGCGGTTGGGGSGGAIRLAANAISGNLTLNVGGGPACNAGAGGAGYVKIEAFDLSGFTPIISPGNAVVTNSAARQAVPANAPQLTIVSVAGVNAPTIVGGLLSSPDITLPTATTGPITVNLAANNIPTSAVVNVTLVPPAGASTTVQSTALAGTTASSTATASVTLPSGASLLYASTTLDLSLITYLKPIFVEGERVRKMEVAASFGGASEITYITESGKRIKRAE